MSGRCDGCGEVGMVVGDDCACQSEAIARVTADRDELLAALYGARLRCPCVGSTCVEDCAGCQRDLALIARIKGVKQEIVVTTGYSVTYTYPDKTPGDTITITGLGKGEKSDDSPEDK